MDERPRYNKKYPFDPNAGYVPDTPRYVSPWDVIGWGIVLFAGFFILGIVGAVAYYWNP